VNLGYQFFVAGGISEKTLFATSGIEEKKEDNGLSVPP
jgi:hypothetical protein